MVLPGNLPVNGSEEALSSPPPVGSEPEPTSSRPPSRCDATAAHVLWEPSAPQRPRDGPPEHDRPSGEGPDYCAVRTLFWADQRPRQWSRAAGPDPDETPAVLPPGSRQPGWFNPAVPRVGRLCVERRSAVLARHLLLGQVEVGVELLPAVEREEQRVAALR